MRMRGVMMGLSQCRFLRGRRGPLEKGCREGSMATKGLSEVVVVRVRVSNVGWLRS